MNNEFLKAWERESNNIAEYFSARYFSNGATSYWVADDIGGVFVINDDYFFNLSDMVDFIKYRYTKKQMFDYYEYALDCIDKKKIKINIKNWIKLK